MDQRTLQAWWAHRQGLDGSLEGAKPDKVLERSGWARSVGGVGPYLTIFARSGANRAAIDKAVASLKIHELPSARGCTYVIPRADFALALQVAGPFNGDMRTASKLGVTDLEVRRLGDAIVKALGKEPLGPDALRQAVGAAARSLGPEGVKKGMSTTLPLALGQLQTQGRIRRVPVDGRLDQQRYRYSAWDPSPIGKPSRSFEEACVELARRFFRWIGPATLGEFQWFSGLGVKAAKVAVDSLKLEPLDEESGRLLHADDLDALRTFTVSKHADYRLVSSLDAIHAHRRDVKGLLDSKDAGRLVPAEKGRAAAGGLTDLPGHAILDRGRLIGLWEFDPDKGRIVWATFGVKDKALDAAVARTEAFVRDDLGDARSFSLDSPKSRLPRLSAYGKGDGRPFSEAAAR